jgi:hypothetical protein
MDEQQPTSAAKPRRWNGRKTQGDSAANKRKVAAMLGAGMSKAEIARKVGQSKMRVTRISQEIDRSAELQAVLQEARARLAPKAIAIAEGLLDKIAESTRGVETVVGKDAEGNAITKMIPPAMREQASALREVAAVAGLTREHVALTGGLGGPAMTINLGSPEVVASFVEALRMLNEPRTIDVTPEQEP